MHENVTCMNCLVDVFFFFSWDNPKNEQLCFCIFLWIVDVNQPWKLETEISESSVHFFLTSVTPPPSPGCFVRSFLQQKNTQSGSEFLGEKRIQANELANSHEFTRICSPNELANSHEFTRICSPKSSK